MTPRRLIAALGVLAVALVVGAGPAFADRLVIRKVDTTQFPTVKIDAIVDGATPAPGGFNLRENGILVGKLVASPIAKTGLPIGTILVIDVSGSMKEKGKLDQAKAAAKQFVAGRLPNERLALVAFSDKVVVLSDFTTDANALDHAIDSLTPSGETALWDGVRRALALFDAVSPDTVRNLVILSDGADTVSSETADTARAGALDARAAVFALGLTGGDFNPGPLEAIAATTGGKFLSTADPAALRTLFATTQHTIQNQYEIQYQSVAKGTLNLELTVSGLTASANSINTGTVAAGAEARPQIVKPASFGPLTGSVGLYIAVLLVIAAAGLVGYALVSLTGGEKSGLQVVLQPYGERKAVVEDEGDGAVTMAETAFMQRAVEVTRRIAEDRGILPRLEAKLEQADLPLRPAEALFFDFAAVVVLTLLALVAGGLFAGLVVFIISAIAPFATLNFLAGRRRKRFTSQLPDTLQLLAGSLRAGYSLMQGVEAVSQEVENPMAYELNRVLVESRLGRPLEEALEDCADRMGSPDFDWAVMAINIQREVGGNLAELLATVGDTMVQRERLRREIRALTAEGRMSAIILGLLPIGLGLMMYTLNPEYMKVLFHDSLGKVMLLGAGLLAAFGFWWMKKIIEIEV